MGLYLLATSARGLFVGMLIVMIIVSLLFGFIVFMLLKPVKKPPEAVSSDNIRSLITHRETQLTVELMSSQDDEKKRTDLMGKLRRLKAAEQVVDELIEEEKAISGESESREKERKAPPRKTGQPQRKAPDGNRPPRKAVQNPRPVPQKPVEPGKGAVQNPRPAPQRPVEPGKGAVQENAQPAAVKAEVKRKADSQK